MCDDLYRGFSSPSSCGLTVVLDYTRLLILGLVLIYQCSLQATAYAADSLDFMSCVDSCYVSLVCVLLIVLFVVAMFVLGRCVVRELRCVVLRCVAVSSFVLAVLRRKRLQYFLLHRFPTKRSILTTVTTTTHNHLYIHTYVRSASC